MDHDAPNFSRSVRDYVLFTPTELAGRMALTDGNIHQVDGWSNQLLWQRTLPDLARYTTPIKGLYCGAGCIPGAKSVARRAIMPLTKFCIVHDDNDEKLLPRRKRDRLFLASSRLGAN